MPTEHSNAATPRRRFARSVFPELDPVRNRLLPSLLTWAERRASSLNIGADRVLVAQRRMADDEYLQCFARASGIAFEPLDTIPRTACPLDDDRLLDAVAAGILPLMRDGTLVFVVALRNTAARGLLQRVEDRPELRGRVRVTSAERLHGFVNRHGGGALGARAAEALRTAAPDLSAATPTHPRVKHCWAVFAAAAIAAFVAAPEEALLATNVAFSLLFLAWMVLRLLGVFIKPPQARPHPPIADADLPVYTVMAAIYREAASVPQLIGAIRQFDWPPEKLDVKIVVEADDVETRAALARIDLEPCFEVIVAPAAGPRTKPKALNAALPFARGSFTVIYDAEDRPEPDQLRAALDTFLRHDRSLACVQAALTIDNTADSWLARGIR